MSLTIADLPPRDADSPSSPAPLPWPGPASALAAGGGFTAFALVAAALGGDVGRGPLPLAALLVPLPVALATTQLTLLVAHQWLALPGRPEDLPRAAADAWCGGGRLALGVVPLLAWFATTSDPSLFRGLAGLLALGTGTATLLGAAGRVRSAIPATTPAERVAADLLAAGWFALAGAVFLLLSYSVATR